MNSLKTLLAVVLFASLAHATEMGLPVQLKFKNAAGAYPDDSNADFVVQVLSPSNGCVLREEHFTSQNVVSGSISLALGTGSRSGFDPNIATLTSVYDNSAAKSNLTCVDSNNNQTASGQTYNPGSTDTRVLRVRATINATLSVADFVQRAAPYALHAESVGGKVASDLLVQNSGTALNQTNLETLLSNATRFNKLQNLAANGIADSATIATTAGTATNFTANLVGDVTGTQSATTVAGIRGITVAATAPTSGQVLGYNGSQYVPMTFVASAPVASVNGQTGAVVLTASNISGVVTSATSLVGDVTGNVSATVVSTVGGKTAAAIASTVTTVNAATTLATPNTLALRDGSGNLIATGVAATAATMQQLYIYEGTGSKYALIKSPNGLASNYTLILPTTDGNSGEVLQTDGSGNLSWAVPSGGVTSAAVTSAYGYTPADDALVVKKSNNLSDLASATAARTNLGLGALATLNSVDLGSSQASGTLAAARLPSFSGDVTSTIGTSVLTLASVGAGVTSGTQYTKVTVDGKGRVTNGAQLSSSDVTTALGFTPADSAASGSFVVKANNLSDLASSATARSNLGLSIAAVSPVGTSAGTVAAGDDARITGALQQTAFNTYVASASCAAGQSMYWNSVSSTFLCANVTLSGDATGNVSAVTVTKLQGTGVSFASIANGHILQYNGTNIVNRAIPTCAAGEYLTYNGTAWSCVVDAGSAGTLASLSVTAPISSTGGSNPTISMPQASGSQNGYLASADWTTFNNKLTSSAASVAATLGYTPANSATVTLKANNLSDLASVATARTNLGLGTFATASSIDLGSASATGTIADARLVNQAGVTSGTQYTKVTVDGKGRVTSGAQLSSSDVTTALGFTPADSAASGTYLVKGNNLSDLVSVATARTNLGLGTFATASTVDLGSASATGTLAAARLPALSGDASTVSGSPVVTLASVGAGVTSGTQYTKVTVDGKGRVTSGAQLSSADVTTALGYTPANNSASGTYLVKASNLSDLTSSATARANLGLSISAISPVGTSAGTVAAGDDARITGSLSQTAFNTYVASASCAAGQSMYWNSVSSTFLCQNVTLSGDATGNVSAVTVTKLQGTGVSFASIANGHILQYNGTNIINRAIPTCSANQYLTFNGTTWSCATDIAAQGIVSSVAVTAPLQTTGGNAPTLSMPVATGSQNGYLASADWTTFNNKITSSAASVSAVLGYTPVSMTQLTNYPLKANNLSDLSNVATARTNLGLGTFATASSIDLGSASATGTLATARLPAMMGDVTSTAGSNSLTVTQIQGVPVTSTAPTTGQLMVYNGSAWVPTTSPDSYTRVTADQTISNTTLANITNMSFSVVNGVTYRFKFNVLYQSSSTLNGFKVTVTVPAGTISANAYIPSTSTDGTDTVWNGYITSSGDSVASTATPATGTTYVAFVEGTFIATATGTLQIQAACKTGGYNVTVKAGSNGQLTVIP